jgi:chemotaxis signal transduction protein
VRALLVPAGGDTYALPVETAREVVAGPQPTPVPTAPGSLVGLLNVRGRIVPLFDIGSLVGAPPAPSCDYAVIIGTSRGSGALVATGLPWVAELGDPVAAAELPGATTVHRLADRLVTLLDPEAVLGPTGVAGPRSPRR